MIHRHLSQPPSDLLRTKLETVASNMTYLYKAGALVSDMDLASAYSVVLNTFMTSLDGSIVGSVREIMKGMPADPNVYSIFINAIRYDLEALFKELETLDKIVVSSFNSIISEYEQTLQITKQTANKLGDYLLYADENTGAGFFFGDSFNSTDRLEVGSKLLSEEECHINTDEGLILLPLDGTPVKPQVKTYIINESSNGTPGNNSEIGVLGKDEILAIGDAQPNTWFEYEKVTAYESSSSLILDLTIVLQELSIINHVNINPINFGTPVPFTIKTIETSRDGKDYMSIKDEIPLKDYLSIDEPNTFTLTAATSKYSGQGFYSFLPRKAQFIHIVFEQHNPYEIQTVNGTRLRYAIGLRDINVVARKFKKTGSVISSPFAPSGDVRKVSIWTAENPIEKSSLADVTHFLSHDDGGTWLPIQPQDRSGMVIPEIVNFNTIDSNSVTTTNPVKNLRHKIHLERFPDGFKGNVQIKEDRLSMVDIVNMSSTSAANLSLTNKPIKETVRIVLPFYGSYSCPRDRSGETVVGQSVMMDLDFVEFGVDNTPIDTLRFKLPFTGIENLADHIRVFVNGEQWGYSAKDSTTVAALAEDAKVYFLNRNGLELQFGAGGAEAIPPGGAKIQVCLDGDNPRLELTDSGYVLMLSASSDGFKENTSIVAMNSLEASYFKAGDMTLSRKKNEVSVEAEASGTSSTTKSSLSIGQGKGLLRNTMSALKATETSFATKVSANNLWLSQVSSTPIKNLPTQQEQENIPFSATENKIRATQEGILPPVFLSAKNGDEWTIDIKEFTNDGTPITVGKQFVNPVEFIDGVVELGDDESSYSFDHTHGVVHLGSDVPADRVVKFYYRYMDVNVVPSEDWIFYKNPITKRVDTQKIILNPKYVSTVTKKIESEGTSKQISLIPSGSNSHGWYNQRLVKGTITISSSMFQNGVRPSEVIYKNGEDEFYNIVRVDQEPIVFSGTGIHTYVLARPNSNNPLIGAPSFAPVYNPDVPSTMMFKNFKTTGLSVNGDWTYTNTDGVVTVSLFWTEELTPHSVSYKFNAYDSGVDTRGLYSIDYNHGRLFFKNAPLAGTVKYEVSMYSAFYNIAEVISDSDIVEINEDAKTVKLSDFIAMKAMKIMPSMKSRPPVAKVSYEYFKPTTESLADLEPYFSPMCTDVAFRAVTSDLISQLEE